MEKYGDARGASIVRLMVGELRAAAKELGVREVVLLDYLDGELDRAEPAAVIGRIAAEIRRVRPQVVVTFDPFGAYGHPDHVAISQFAASAVVAAAALGTAASSGDAGVPHARHAVSKLYYFVNDERKWAAYQSAFKTLVSRVDGVERRVTAWPDWSISASVDTRAQADQVWRAVQRHETQMAVYRTLADLTPEHHEGLWGVQTFYRAMSLVNGGRGKERDRVEGVR